MYKDDNGVARVTLRDTPTRATSLPATKTAGMTPVGTSRHVLFRVPRERGLWLAIQQNVAFHYTIEDHPTERKCLNYYAYLTIPYSRRKSKLLKQNIAKLDGFRDFPGAQKPRNLPWT